MNTIIQTIAKRHKVVRDAFRHVINSNDAQHNPYHNTDHLLFVAQKCYEGGLYHQLDDNQIDALIVAALFHDFNHSGGEHPDWYNVKVAVNSFRDFFMDGKYHDGEFYDDVIDIIRGTEYPYVTPKDILTIRQKIIRDADLMQATADNWFGMIMLGLSKEAKGVDLDKMTSGNLKFHMGIEMCTEWGQRVFDAIWDDVFKNLEALDELLKEK